MKMVPASLTIVVTVIKLPLSRKVIKIASDMMSKPIIANPNDIDISDKLCKLHVLDLTYQIVAPKKAKGIIRTSGMIPALPSPGSVHRLFAVHCEDPGGAIGRLDGHDIQVD